MSTQPILAFDSACTGASIALMVDGCITTRAVGQTSQAAELVPAIDTLMKEAGIAYDKLGCIVSTVGPGSFTGVRIGLAALHGFVLVNNTTLKAITTLEAMAWDVAQRDGSPKTFIVALRAGKGEVYAQTFTLAQGTPKAVDMITLYPEAKNDWVYPCFGNQLAAKDTHYLNGPDATILCRIADKLPTASLAEAMPVYIRPPDAIVGTPHAWLTVN